MSDSIVVFGWLNVERQGKYDGCKKSHDDEEEMGETVVGHYPESSSDDCCVDGEKPEEDVEALRHHECHEYYDESVKNECSEDGTLTDSVVAVSEYEVDDSRQECQCNVECCNPLE